MHAATETELAELPPHPVGSMVLGGAERITHLLEIDWFPGCRHCDNAATRRATLRDVSLVELRRLHERARRTWDCRLDAAIRERSLAPVDRAGARAAAIA